jgi:hypothetical protein
MKTYCFSCELIYKLLVLAQHTLEEKMFFILRFMQLKMLYATKK